MVKVLITRHGETKQNVDRIVQGKEHGNINENGFRQIKYLSNRLKTLKIGKIISSDIPRCKITTEEILKNISASVVYTKLIREKDNGGYVGKSHSDFSWNDLEGSFEERKAPNGENLLEVRERARKFMSELRGYKESEKTLLVVSHGAFLKIFIGDLLGMELYDSIFKISIDHCSLTELEISDNYKEGYRLNFINSIEHFN